MATKSLPIEERYGLQSQLRRAAVSAPANIVEGSSRSSSRDYSHFLSMSLGSASELRYLLSLSRRLELLNEPVLEEQCDQLVRGLQRLIDVVGTEVSRDSDSRSSSLSEPET